MTVMHIQRLGRSSSFVKKAITINLIFFFHPFFSAPFFRSIPLDQDESEILGAEYLITVSQHLSNILIYFFLFLVSVYLKIKPGSHVHTVPSY